MTGKRGRPKQYDADVALKAAGDVFWNKGFSGTSLDDLSTAMGMNRPSIYRAFGDKETIYRLTLAEFGRRMNEAFEQTIGPDGDFQHGLARFYRAALDVYCGDDVELGCMVMCTAPAAAMAHPEVRAELSEVIATLDGRLLARVESAIDQGQLPKSADARVLSKLLQAVLHSLAIRARAGESKVSLQRFVDGAIVLILGAA